MESRGVSRHTACKSCRDRKVRCDGAQPACEKCRRAGEECEYLQAYRPAKPDLSQMVEMLQQRLEQTEAQLQRIDSPPNRAQPPFSPEFVTPPTPSLQNPPLMSSDDSSFSWGQANFLAGTYQNPLKQSPEISGGEFLGCVPAGNWMASRNNNLQFQADDAEMIGIAEGNTIISIPSFREIREMNSAPSFASTGGHHWPLSAPNTRPEGDENGVVSTELKTLLSEMFATQAEIAGISLVVAEYLAWMRKAPTPRSIEMLQTIEFRLREINELAEKQSWKSSENMMSPSTSASALDPLGRERPHPTSYLGSLGEDVCRRTAELEHFFKTDYTFRTTLSDQRRPQIMKSGWATPRAPTTAPEPQRERKSWS